MQLRRLNKWDGRSFAADPQYTAATVETDTGAATLPDRFICHNKLSGLTGIHFGPCTETIVCLEFLYGSIAVIIFISFH